MITIAGGGLAGLASAYELARRGASVRLYDPGDRPGSHSVARFAGGMLAAHFQLDISAAFFLRALPDAVPVANLWMGLGKGVVFGILIALTACHFGLRIEPNTRSLGEGTTASVVTSITVVIVADAIFAILFKDIGL